MAKKTGLGLHKSLLKGGTGNLESSTKRLNKRLEEQKEENAIIAHIDAMVKIEDILIDPELQTLIRFHTEEEFTQFKENLVGDGKVREPIIVTNSLTETGYTLVDGHHRLKASEELVGEYPNFAKIPAIVLSFESKEAVLIWMLTNQLGRRNITRAERFDITMKLNKLGYFKEKAKKSQGERTDLKTSFSPENEEEKKSNRIVNQIADVANISVMDASRLKKVYTAAPDVYQDVLRGNKTVNSAYNEILAKERKENTPKILQKKLTKTALFEVLQSKKLVLDIATLFNEKATTLTIRFTQLKHKDHIIQAIKPHYKDTDVLVVGYCSNIEGIEDKLKYCDFVFYVTDKNEDFKLPEKVGLLFIDKKQRITISKNAIFNNIGNNAKSEIFAEIIGFLLVK